MGTPILSIPLTSTFDFYKMSTFVLYGTRFNLLVDNQLEIEKNIKNL